jgi:hypothetical protein
MNRKYFYELVLPYGFLSAIWAWIFKGYPAYFLYRPFYQIGCNSICIFDSDLQPVLENDWLYPWYHMTWSCEINEQDNTEEVKQLLLRLNMRECDVKIV